MIRWLADFTAWYKWDRHAWAKLSFSEFRALTQRIRREGKLVYVRGWRARCGN